MIPYVEYVIDIQGQQAVDAGYALQDGHCYKVIKDWNGRFMGQLEVVLDEPETVYNGIVQQWVQVAFVRQDDIQRVLSYLAKNGFTGCPCEISQESLENERPDGKKDEGTLCCMII